MYDISHTLNQIMRDYNCSPICALLLCEGGLVDEPIQSNQSNESLYEQPKIQPTTSKWDNMGTRY